MLHFNVSNGCWDKKLKEGNLSPIEFAKLLLFNITLT